MTAKNLRPVFTTREFPLIIFYIAAISLALMYVICRSYLVLCTVIMTAVSCGVYMLFYALRRRRGFAALAVVALSLMCACALGTVQLDYSSDSFMDFVFTASDFFDPFYAGVAILLFSVVVGFTTCYFSVYSPRPCFLLMPSFIPLILSARTAGGLPAGMLIFMLAGFAVSVAVMARPEYPQKHIYTEDKRAVRERIAAAALAGVLMAGLLAVIPRSDTTPMGEYLDNVFTNGRGYFAGSQRLTNFQASSSVNRGANKPEGNLLFAAKASEPMNIDRWSFDMYNGSDGWTMLGDYNTGYAGWERYAQNRCAAVLLYKLKNAAENGALTDYAEMLEDIPCSFAKGMYIEDEANSAEAGVYIQVLDGSSTKVILHPYATFFVTVPGYSDDIYRTPCGEIFSNGNLKANASYGLNYYADEPNEAFIKAVERIDFEKLLRDALSEDVITSDEANAFISEHEFAEEYREKTASAGITDSIAELAKEITAGLSSDYDKALAIEQWFGEQGFVYDMDYVPAKVDAEYFIFDSKTGICSDFATATTLLARAAGLTARYTEGFALSEDILGEDGLYYVTDAQAHAYTMVYLDGYGWMELDATKYASLPDSAEGAGLWIIVIAAGAALAAVLVMLFRNRLSELIFAVTFPFRKPRDRVRAVFVRTRRLACAISGGDPESTSVGEVRDIISRSLSMGEQAEEICAAADELFYGNSGELPADSRRLYKRYREIRRMKRRMRR